MRLAFVSAFLAVVSTGFLFGCAEQANGGSDLVTAMQAVPRIPSLRSRQSSAYQRASLNGEETPSPAGYDGAVRPEPGRSRGWFRHHVSQPAAEFWASLFGRRSGVKNSADVVGGEGPPPDDDQVQPYDPFSPINERILSFNTWFDDHVGKPAAEVWAAIWPLGARKSLRRFFRNLGEPSNAVNCLLQGRYLDAGESTARFAINTTVGAAGFFDVAHKWFGIERHRTDFGLTLAHFGMNFGPYLMSPFAGPSALRDALSGAADGTMNPLAVMVYTLPQLIYTPVLVGVGIIYGLNERSLSLDTFEDVNRYSIDLYGAVQDYYYQKRLHHQVPGNSHF